MKICLVNKILFFKTVKNQPVDCSSFMVLAGHPLRHISTATNLSINRALKLSWYLH